MRFKLRVIPEVEALARSGLKSETQITIQGPLKGVSYDCGACGLPIIKGVMPGDIVHIVVYCNGCGAYNDTDALPDE